MPTCFVIMPFGPTTETHTKQYWEEHFRYVIKSAVDEAGMGYEAKISNPAGGGIVDEVFRNLQDADVVLADLTDFNPNVMYELGIRHCLNDRTILLLEEGPLDIPFYFKNYKVIRYNLGPRGQQLFKEEIKNRLYELSNRRPNASDNPVFDYFAQSGKRVAIVPRQGPDLLQVLAASGFSAIYVPETNSARNIQKEKVLVEAQEFIKLLASTGHSYLAVTGSRFQPQLVKRLNANIPTQIILLNPWSDSGVLLALGELSKELLEEKKSSPSATLTPTQIAALEQLRKGNLWGFNPVNFIRESTYYKLKFTSSISGYEQLRQGYGNKIELKLLSYEIVATTLLTEQSGFFEPYLEANLGERHQNLMLTFELEFTEKCGFYRHCVSYFDTLWDLAIPYEEFQASEERWKSRLRAKYRTRKN